MSEHRGVASVAHTMMRAATDPPPDLAHVHPQLRTELSALTFRDDGTPDRESWLRVLDAIDAHYRTRDQLRSQAREGEEDSARFADLFRSSPIPMMEQDYTKLESWMDGLRKRGVTDIREHLAGDLDRVRAVVPMITISAANPAAIRAVGLPFAELMGPVDPAIVNQEALPSWVSQIDAVWSRRPVSQASYVAVTATGRIYDAESVLAAPVMDGEPDFSRAVFTIMDVTGHRNEERRMQELVDTKNRFLASVSHEIRTPLTAVLGFATMLDNGDYAPDELDAMVSAIATHAQDVADLVEDLLVAARAESGQVDIVLAPVDVMSEISQTLAAGGSFTTDVTVVCESSPPPAVADATRFRQILRNLLTNAKKYGGPTVTISVKCGDGVVDVAVADDGCGLPFAEWERIFEPYHRAHTAEGITESVGIGLAISRQLAELMDGRLEYRFSRGHSIFTLSLPAA